MNERAWSPSAARELALARAYQIERAGDEEKSAGLRRMPLEVLEDLERFRVAWRAITGEEAPRP